MIGPDGGGGAGAGALQLHSCFLKSEETHETDLGLDGRCWLFACYRDIHRTFQKHAGGGAWVAKGG